MDFEITYVYQNENFVVLLQGMQNLLGAINQFYEDHVRGCIVIKVEKKR